MAQVALTAADGRQVADVMSRLGDVCDAIEAELARRPRGRPREWTVHGIIAGLLLLAVHERKFHICHNESLLGTLSDAQQARLHLLRPNGRPFTTRQISYAWNEIARSLDPAQPGVEGTERVRRLELLTKLSNDMLWATLPKDVRAAWGGHVAVDATMLSAHGRAPNMGNDKQYVTGKDGDGRPRYLSQIDAGNFDPEPGGHPFLQALVPNMPAPEAYTSSGRRRRFDRKKRAVGARWIGNTSYRKVVYGYAHHTAVICAGENEAVGALPCVAVGQVTSPTTANPAACGRILVEDIERRGRAAGIELGDVLADGGYSQAKPEHWQLPIRALGGEPIFRLHGTNQEGHRGSIRQGRVLKIDGRFYCACLPEDLRNATYPHRPTRDRNVNRQRTAEYRATIAARRPYELRLRARNGRKGLRFDTPHNNGCGQCSSSDRTCCGTKSITVGWDELGQFQRHQFGSERWAESYNRRNLVEGYFGNLKNASVGGHTRDTAQFFEYAKIVLAFTFNAMATNLARIASWRAQRASLEGKRRRSGRPNMNPTLDEIAENDGLLEQVRDRKRRRRRGPPRRSKPERNPFAHLGAAPQ